MSRMTSDKNQVRRSVSSIQTSIKLAVATSLCCSQTSCVERSHSVSSRLSAKSSASTSFGVTNSLLLSCSRWCREISPTERSVGAPILRARSAITSWRKSGRSVHPEAGGSRESCARSCANGSSSSSRKAQIHRRATDAERQKCRQLHRCPNPSCRFPSSVPLIELDTVSHGCSSRWFHYVYQYGPFL